jgi:hypothetical protein
VRLLQYHVGDRREIAGQRVDALQHLDGRGLSGKCFVTLDRPLIQLPLRFVPFGTALVKFASKVGNSLRPIGQRARS